MEAKQTVGTRSKMIPEKMGLAFLKIRVFIDAINDYERRETEAKAAHERMFAAQRDLIDYDREILERAYNLQVEKEAVT